MRGVLGGSLQFSYTHSSFRSNLAGGLGDQDLLPLAADFNHPTRIFRLGIARPQTPVVRWHRYWILPRGSDWA